MLHAADLVLRAGGTARGRVLLADGNVTATASERWVVLGPNGAGKSSLLAALAGVFPIERGRICIDGRALDAWPARALADRRAWCPQFWSDPFPASVRETLALAMERGRWWPTDGPRTDPVLDAWIDRLDLRALEAADVRTLSGGERQRVALGTTLLQRAPLLLLDEPASHLDLRHRRLLLDVLLDHAARGGVVVACMHDLDLAWALATHAVLLDARGGFIAGPRDDVMTAERIGAAFDVAVDAIDVAGQRHFAVALSARSTT
jgi:iron complex transport system ATP-binding protein